MRRYQAKRRAEDPDFLRKMREYHRAYRLAHKEEINSRRRQRYATDPETRERHRAYTASYRRVHHLKTRYGVSMEQYSAMLARQGGVCAICKQKSSRMLGVDHCHKTGKVRGLLCSNCNSALGLYGDDPRLTREATAYLVASLDDSFNPDQGAIS